MKWTYEYDESRSKKVTCINSNWESYKRFKACSNKSIKLFSLMYRFQMRHYEANVTKFGNNITFLQEKAYGMSMIDWGEKKLFTEILFNFKYETLIPIR